MPTLTKPTDPAETALKNEKREQRSLAASKWGNLFMAVSGVIAAYVSHSDAILLDGLYSAVGFISAILAASVSRSATKPADDIRPFGYDADEAIYATFRSLSIIGLILFASSSAVMRILEHIGGNSGPALVYGPIYIYFAILVALSLGLSALHFYNWRSSGKMSDLLLVEARAALVDGTITAAAGIGLIVLPFLAGTPLAGLIPIGDSIILLSLCVLIISNPLASFRKGLNELKGLRASDEIRASVEKIVLKCTDPHGFAVNSFYVGKLGRTFTVLVYVNPNKAITSKVVDQLSDDLAQRISREIGRVRVYPIISEGTSTHTVSIAEQTAEKTAV